ncbi:MAG: FMN-binding glutamate synthase family protein [Bacteriovoracaceae bacterium]|jgi:glutamate synthase domain-containing protein 2|nr:FMN-binding glutamate synthase family protein [Bacteriovoracaceae bacterium]
MRKQFLWSVLPVNLMIFILGRYVNPGFNNLFVLSIPLSLLGIRDVFQRKHTILRNYPIIGHFRYLLESIRPEIQQYFVERFDDGRPFSREQRSIVYQRAKGDLDTSAFGTQWNVYSQGSEWVEHTLKQTQKISEEEFSVVVGNEQCRKPYRASRLNISAMSYGSLSKTAIEALNWGAKLGGFFHNTGEGGISPYHKKHGGDLCWQIGTGYFGCRTKDGLFDEDLFAQKVKSKQVKLIEIKLSQGAKPGHGGMLPGKKVNREIADIRTVEVGKDVISPPVHSAFVGPDGLLKFVARLRELSEGKPVGFKLCIGSEKEFFSICKAMLELKIFPDFITVDGAEGGTGAAPREFSNSLGTPLSEGLNFVHSALIGCGVRNKIKIFASGKIVDPFDMMRRFALGADVCMSARGMMFALGCIQALRCNTNHCPAGIATQDSQLYSLLDVKDKAERVARFHDKTLEELTHILQAIGVHKIAEIEKKRIRRRDENGQVLNYSQIFPKMEYNALVSGDYSGIWKDDWEAASATNY